jgi:hypothetical protein
MHTATDNDVSDSPQAAVPCQQASMQPLSFCLAFLSTVPLLQNIFCMGPLFRSGCTSHRFGDCDLMHWGPWAAFLVLHVLHKR